MMRRDSDKASVATRLLVRPLLVLVAVSGAIMGQVSLHAQDNDQPIPALEIPAPTPVEGMVDSDQLGVSIDRKPTNPSLLTPDDPSLQTRGGGFFFAGGEVVSSPKPVKLDNDSRPGVVIGNSLGEIYLLDADGIVVPGWPVTSTALAGYSTAAVADIDQDGSEDIVIHASGSLEIYDQSGTSLGGWPKTLDSTLSGNSRIASPVVADLDNDGDWEILVGHFQKMYAFHHDGTAVAGWPITQAHGFGPTFSTPAVGDLDSDGDLEICFKIYGGNGDPADILVLHHDGSAVSGWPKLNLDRSHVSSPVFADVDGDGALDIIVTLHFFTDGNYVRLYVWHGDGTNVSGFPAEGFWNTAPLDNVVGDVDEDGFPEILVSTSNATSPFYAVHAWNHDGSVLSGAWPRSASLCAINNSPALVDVNGGANEIVMGVGGCYVNDTGAMHVWNSSGSLLAGWPANVTGWLRSSPLVMDSDDDGVPEIYAGSSDGWIHRIATSDASGGDPAEWNQIFHDPRNTNLYAPPEGTFTKYGDGCPGTGGITPDLCGIGVPSPDETVTLQVTGALANSVGFLFLSATSDTVPFGNCTLHLGAPLIGPFLLGIDQNGVAELTGGLGPNIPTDLHLYWQYLAIDNGAPVGNKSASNGLDMFIR